MKYPIKNQKKDFDAVKMMREIRDQLSREMMNMSHDEQQAYIKKLLKQGSVKKAA